jgi:hypothetical protein
MHAECRVRATLGGRQGGGYSDLHHFFTCSLIDKDISEIDACFKATKERVAA